MSRFRCSWHERHRFACSLKNLNLPPIYSWNNYRGRAEGLLTQGPKPQERAERVFLLHFCPQTLCVSPLSHPSFALPSFRFFPSDQRPSSWRGQSHVGKADDLPVPRYASLSAAQLHCLVMLLAHIANSCLIWPWGLLQRCCFLGFSLPVNVCVSNYVSLGVLGYIFPWMSLLFSSSTFFNHSTSAFITSVFIDASCSFRCVGLRVVVVPVPPFFVVKNRQHPLCCIENVPQTPRK